MGLFDNIIEQKGKILNRGWIQITDDKSSWTIEDFPYETGVLENATKPHCWKCVTINKCWFKNEIEKMPKELDLLGTINKYGLLKLFGLYHINCHCKKHIINIPSSKNIKLIIPEGKEQYTVNNKLQWILSLGYLDTNKFFKDFYNSSIESYINSNYVINEHSKYGFKITLYVNMQGQNYTKDNVYKIKSSYTVFPNG